MIDTSGNDFIKWTWAVNWGKYGDEGFVLFISKTKKRAIGLIKKEGGFSYNRHDDLWKNDEVGEWYRIEEIEYVR